ncbi:MAG: ABC transporter ATP-binding protein [Oscillospiraceae bacterium]|nr:ABC transporter ATP-binding protein [Oscillospiraceae bacterium]
MAVNRYDKDEELREGVNFSYFAMMKKYVSPYAGKLVLCVLSMLLVSVLGLLPPYLIGIALDKCLPEKNYTLLFILGGVLIGANIITALYLRYRSIFANKMGMDIIKDIRHDLFEHLQKLPFSFFDSRPHGKILVRVVNYINSIAGLLSGGFLDMIANVFTLFGIIGFMLALDVKFTLICLAGLPIFLVVLLVVRKYHRRAWQNYSTKQSNMNAYIQESISGMKITQSFAREEKNAEIFDGLCGETKSYWMKSTAIGQLTPRFTAILSTVVLAIVYYVGARAIGANTMTVGVVVAFASYISQFWNPIIGLTTIYNDIVNCGAYLERIFEMMEEPVVIEDYPDAYEMKDVKGDISFKNVTFAYEKGAPNVLENVSFDVRAGESIALVGPTGAGKSTVINLLSRFYDIQDGQITVDGRDIKFATKKSLRSQMGIMLQDSVLFTGTIADNIRYGRLDATDEEIIEAAKTVCAHDFIMEFPDGYNTQVTEGGASLSVGQKQLIAFARTLIADPKILILDEATSSIDTETEKVLQRGLEKLLEGRTSFIIAHRLSTIKNSSRIMYIADRGVAEAGTHDELIERDGRYAELYRAQYKFLEQM